MNETSFYWFYEALSLITEFDQAGMGNKYANDEIGCIGEDSRAGCLLPEITPSGVFVHCLFSHLGCY